ncbi:MAG: PTS sugar transporter subunit IIC [Clostridiaceae bacterium]|nr:PTS sugar transporter subunit IIC [Clostridiaceae bacterium]
MEKFQAAIEKLLVPVAAKLNGQRHVSAIRDAFILSFPLTMAGSLMVLINNVFLAPDGFLGKICHLHDVAPWLADYQTLFSPVIKGSTNIYAILITFLIARNLAKDLKADDILTGLTAMSVFFIVYTDYTVTDGVNFLNMTYMGAQGLFVGIIVALVVGEAMARLSKSDKLEIKMPEQVPPAVARSFKSLLPIIIVTAVFSIANFIILQFEPEGLNKIIYTVLQKPLTSVGKSIGSVIVLELISNVLWVMGIHGPNTIGAIRDTMFAEANNANLQYYATSGTAWGAPYPVTWSYDLVANLGGSGCTLGLLIAIFIFSKVEEQRSIAKLAIAPGVFNINEPVIFGLPIVLNPIFIVPFIVAPLVNVIIAYTLVSFELMPPMAVSVPWTTPGFLAPFFATGMESFVALALGFVCLIVSTLIYMPFVIAASKLNAKKSKKEAERAEVLV